MNKKPYKIGLTGGIGCGKSEVRRRVAKHGVPTIDADSLSKKIAADDKRAIAAIKKAFGRDVYGTSGELQRHVLADKVFGNQESLAKLNAILHPLVFEYVNRQIAELDRAGKTLAVIEAALFYESGWDKQMDIMVVVKAPMAKRLEWLKKRDGVTPNQIQARMAHQVPVDEKAKRADYVIENNGSLSDLDDSIRRMLHWLHKNLK